MKGKLVWAALAVAGLAAGGMLLRGSLGRPDGGCCAAISLADDRAASRPDSRPASKPATQPAGKYVNTRCPIMGGVINPARVTDDLTREYKGQKVAFCCGGCPAEWDKLSPAEKDAKLKAVTGAK